MTDNPFADLIPGAPRAAPPRRAPTAQQGRRLEMQATGENIESANISQARGRTQARVESALADATIRKGMAEARSAEINATAAALKAKYPQLSEYQAVAAARYINMDEGNRLYENALARGYKPDALGNRVTYMLEKIPFGGQELADWLRSPLAEQADLGVRLYKAGQRRAETGQAGPKEEGPEVRTRTFPSPFAVDTKERREQLRRVRLRQIAAQRATAGAAAEATQIGGLPPGVTPAEARAQAVSAIKDGKPRAAVLQRLQQMGVSTEGL